MNTQNLFEPGYNHVIVQKIELNTFSDSNIIVPDMDDNKPHVAKVIATGPGDITVMGNLIPMPYKIGDIVTFGNFAGVKLIYEGEEYIVVKDRDIFTKINIEQ